MTPKEAATLRNIRLFMAPLKQCRYEAISHKVDPDGVSYGYIIQCLINKGRLKRDGLFLIICDEVKS